ncbi:MAG: hypothetical protein U0M06_12540 [Clostridia bacterium]|nr:hypothetical protein [Clostridia bacterium]
MTNERWYSLTIEEAEIKLNTNVSSGLDPKEAERRRRRGEAGAIYKGISKSPLYHASKIAADITVILFLLTAIISAFFDSGISSVAAAVLTVITFIISIVCYSASRRRFETMAEYSVPSARVLRGGRVYNVDCRDVVTGDVLLLEKGDVLPCDCRLVSSEGMRAVEFVGKIGGKEKKMLTEKDAESIIRSEDKPNVFQQKNMIGAAAVIISGRGRAIAVRTGRKTFVSLMLGELEICKSEKREMTVLGGISGLLSKLTLAILISAVPFSLISMIPKGNELSILDVLLVFLALTVTLGSEMLIGFLYLFPSSAMKRTDSANSPVIKYPGAIEELNYIDSIVLLGSKTICVKGKNVESLFAANRFYDADKAEKNSETALNCLIDLALLGTSHYLDFGIGSAVSVNDTDIQNSRAIAEFAENCGIDRKKLTESYQLVEFSPGVNSGIDTSLVKKDDEYRVICVSENDSLLGLCTHIRTPEGALYLDPGKKSDIIRACSQLTKKAKSLTLVASRISPCSSLSRLGAVQNQLVFEGYIVYSDPYIGDIGETVEELREADISLYYVADENAESVINAFNIGAVKGKSEIAYSSAFKRFGRDILQNFGQYRAYLGFAQKDIEKLIKHIRGEDGTLAVIASDTEHLIFMNSANVSASPFEDSEGKEALTSIGNHSEIIKKSADILLPLPNKSGGGFKAFADAIISSKSACAGLCKFMRYMAFSASLRLVLSVLPLLFGKMLLSAPQLIFIGALIDVAAIICLSANSNTLSFADKIADIETIVSSPLKSLAKYMISGAALGAIMLMLTTVFGTSGIASGKPLSVFALLGTVLSELFALFIISDFSHGSFGSRFVVIQCISVVILILLSVFIPPMGAILGVTYPGWQLLASAPLVSVIGYVMILVTDRYI